MKWGVRKSRKYADDDIVIDKGTSIRRIVPKNFVENEKAHKGHAYASVLEEDTKRYRDFAKMFGATGDNYVNMEFKAKDVIVSPGEKKRVDEFVKLMSENTTAKQAMVKGTRSIFNFMPKSTLEKLDDPKKRDKAYRKFSYMLVSNRELRDPYFKSLEDQGYSMIIDDADRLGGISNSPIIVFDRSKSLTGPTISKFE